MPWAMSWCAVVPGARLRRTGGVCIGVSPYGRGARPAPVVAYSPLQYAPELRRCEYQEPRSFVRRSILQRWIGHQLGSVSLVGSSTGGAGGFPAPFPVVLPEVWAFMAAAPPPSIPPPPPRRLPPPPPP